MTKASTSRTLSSSGLCSLRNYQRIAQFDAPSEERIFIAFILAVGAPVIGLCRLCDQIKELVKAHAIPRKWFEGIRGTGNFSVMINANKPVKKAGKFYQAGVYDSEILCADCEAKFSGFDLTITAGKSWESHHSIIRCTMTSKSFLMPIGSTVIPTRFDGSSLPYCGEPRHPSIYSIPRSISDLTNPSSR